MTNVLSQEEIDGLLNAINASDIQISKRTENRINKVSVRWFDGYLEEFECSEVCFGAYILWMRLITGKERIIPLSQVRWFGQSVESHQG